MQSIEMLNNTATSKPCIIIGSGPSVKDFDFSIVKSGNVKTIAVNGGYEKYSNSDYFVSDDQGAFFTRYFHNMKKTETKVLLYQNKYEKYNLLESCSNLFGDRLFVFRHKTGYNLKMPYKHEVEEHYFPQARSSSITALYVAITLGFECAYLIGMDCIYNSGFRYFWGTDRPRTDLKNPFLQRRFKRFVNGFETDSDLLEILDNYKLVSDKISPFIKVFNLSKISLIDVFPKVDCIV